VVCNITPGFDGNLGNEVPGTLSGKESGRPVTEPPSPYLLHVPNSLLSQVLRFFK
jgi:hypothetical protein